MTRSRRLAGLAVTGALALTCAGWETPAQAAPSTDTPVATAQLSSTVPTEVRYVWSGASGFQYWLPESGSGATTTVGYPDFTPPQHAGPDDLASGNDVSNTRTENTVAQKHRSTGATATVAVPDGQAYRTAVGWSVLTQDGAGAPHILRAAADGTTTKAQDIPAWQARTDGLALAGGELQLYGNTTHTGGIYGFYTVPLDPTGRPTRLQARRGPTPAPASPCLTGDAACPQLEALGDGRITYLWTDSAGKESVNVVGEDATTIRNAPTGDSGGRIGSASGRYVLYNGGSAGAQKVTDFPKAAAGTTTLDRTRTAATVWGRRLWTPGSTQGTVVAYDLKTKQNVATVSTGAPCTPSELQAVNTWLYWSCGSAGPAGVYDRAAGRAITVPSGQARLADGYLVRENRTTHELLLTDFHTGTATTRTVAVLPTADQNTGGSNGRWAVDRFGGNVAYLTDKGKVALVTANVPTSPLAQMEAQTDPVTSGPITSNPWKPVWQLSKPSTWTLTLATSAGTVVRTLTGTSTAAAVRASWDGYRQDGTRVKGTYTWTLTAEPRDGQGPALTLTGTTTVN